MFLMSLQQQQTLLQNQVWETKTRFKIPDQSTTPYWLLKEGDLGNYTVEEETLKGLAETPNPITVQFTLLINTTPITLSVPLTYRTTDRVAGEVIQNFQVLPRATTQLRLLGQGIKSLTQQLKICQICFNKFAIQSAFIGKFSHGCFVSRYEREMRAIAWPGLDQGLCYFGIINGEYNNNYVMVMRLKEGKIIFFQEYMSDLLAETRLHKKKIVDID